MITVRKSSIHNSGVFADIDIPKGKRIIEYVGEKITTKEGNRRLAVSNNKNKNDPSHGAVYIFELNKRYDIDGNVPYNTARHINHSCDPNCEFDIIRGRIWIIAIRDIKKGEELSYNYGYNINNYTDHPCYCGTKRCVGYILNEEDWHKIQIMNQPASE